MEKIRTKTRLTVVMERLSVNARQLSALCGVNHSLITKWQRGERQLRGHNKGLRPMAAALAQLDTEDALPGLLAPFAFETGSTAGDLALYLCGQDDEVLLARAAPAARQVSGEYVMQTRVYLGKKGMRKATNDVLDYVLTLPPGREILCVAHGNFEWVTANLPYTLMLIQKLRKAFARGTRLTMVIRKGFSVSSVAMFAGPWVTAHMRGYIRSLYYDGPQPPGERIVASIAGYWSLSMREDPEVEDGLFIQMHTDPLAIRQDTHTCEEWRSRANALATYEVLGRYAEIDPAPGRSICAIQSVPGICFTTGAELAEAAGEMAGLPGALLWPGGETPGGPPGPVKLILNKDAVRTALQKQRTVHEVFSKAAARRVYIGRETLRAQLARILKAAEGREDFEVALVPGKAFEKIGLEMVSWEGSALLAWTSDTLQSMYTYDETMRGSIHGFGLHTWNKLQAGWKRKRQTLPLLRKWLRGEGLDVADAETAYLRNWDVLPKE